MNIKYPLPHFSQINMDPAEVRKTRLRIAFRTGSTPPDQNSVFPSGEVEDYLIELRVPQCDQMIPVAYTVYGTNIMPYCNEYTDRKIRMLQNRLPRGFGRIATRVKKAVSRRYGRGRAVSSWYASKENYDLGTKMDPAPVSPAFTGAFDPKWFSVANDLQEVDPGQHVFQDLKMDIYYPESVEGVTLGDLTASPVIIYLPGGTFAWNMRQTELTDKTCEWLASSGYVVAAIDYRTGIHVEDEEAAKRAIIRAWQDSQAAVKWWRMPQNHVHQDADGELLWKIDPDKIYIMGHGAGGVTAQLNVHLAKSRLNTEIGTIGDPGTLWAVGDMYDLNGSNTYDLRQHPVIPCITLSNGTNTCDVVGNDPGNASGGYFTNHADQPLVQSALDTYLALDGRAQRSVSLAGGILETDWLLNDPIRPSLLVHHEDDAVIRNQTAALDVRNYGDIIATDVVTLSGSGAMNSAWMSGAGSGTLLSLELSNAEESITSGGGGSIWPYHPTLMQENEDYDTYITEDGSIPLSLDTALLYGIDAFFMNDWEEEGDASRIASPETPLSAVQETAQKESEKEMFIVFPNPAKDQVNIMLTLKKNSPLEVEIVDMQGKQVYNDYIYQASPGTNYIQLTKLDLPTGTYMLKVKSQESERQKKLIIIESK